MLKKLFLLLCLLTITACGYQHPLSNLEGDDHYIIQAVMWRNQTNELGLEAVIGQAVNDWLSESNRLRLTSSNTEAQYVLQGTIVAIDLPGLSYGASEVASELRGQLTVNYTLRDKASGKVLLNRQNVIKSRAFRVGADAPHHRTNKEAALAAMADELGEDVYMNVYRALTSIIRYQ